MGDSMVNGTGDPACLGWTGRVGAAAICAGTHDNLGIRRGANDVLADLFKKFAMREGRLSTGQQQYSGRKVAELIIDDFGT